MLAYNPHSGMYQQVPGLIHINFVCAIDRKGDLFGIGAWRDVKVIFQIPFIAVIDQVYSWIDVLVFDLSERRNICVPVLRIISQEIISRSRKRLNSSDSDIRVGVDRAQINDGTVGRLVAGLGRAPSLLGSYMLCRLKDLHNQLIGSQEHDSVLSVGSEPDLAVGLTGIKLEADRQRLEVRSRLYGIFCADRVRLPDTEADIRSRWYARSHA